MDLDWSLRADVTAFHVGDVHRMLVSVNTPANPPRTTLDAWPRMGRNPALWPVRTDQASAP